jgi:hypothetical protein
MARIDTHDLVKALIEGNMSEKNAETLGKAFFTISNTNENFVTKEQITHLEQNQDEIKTDIKIIKSDISHLKESVVEIKTTLKWGMAVLIGILGLLVKITFLK